MFCENTQTNPHFLQIENCFTDYSEGPEFFEKFPFPFKISKLYWRIYIFTICVYLLKGQDEEMFAAVTTWK